MAEITNLTTLNSAITNFLARSDLTSFYPEWIRATEDYLNRKLLLRNEETALSVSISGGTATVPTDFKRLKFAYYDANPEYILRWSNPEEVYEKYPERSNTNYPCLIAREGANFIFGPGASDGTLKGIYWAKQDSILDTDPSWYVTNAPTVLLSGCLYWGNMFIKDYEAADRWQMTFREYVDSLDEENMDAEYSAGVNQMRPMSSMP